MTRLLLVTGISGAGKSTALHALEDLGYETVDNVPLSLLPTLIQAERNAAVAMPRIIVVGVDIRSRDFSADYLSEAISAIRKAGAHRVETLYLTCDDAIIQQRYTETRRKHPLALDRPIADGIARERELIGGAQQWADTVIDTSQMTVADLRHSIQNRFPAQGGGFSIFVQSFSFRMGIPRDADMVFDVRFLRNPHYDDALRPFTGQHAAVGEYIKEDTEFETFFQNLTQLLLPLLPRYQREGKSYFTIAIGCTGGKHRSVFVAEQLVAFLTQKGYHLQHRHRDMPVDIPIEPALNA
jgi:UPF0042 nucleotide-binding protein